MSEYQATTTPLPIYRYVRNCPCDQELIATIKETVENPDFMGRRCKEHAFYIKKYGKRWAIVFAEGDRGDKGFEIKCFEWLEKAPKRRKAMS